MPLPDLVASTDPAIAQFASGDQDLFLKAAGDAVRKYCGWHIYPSVDEVNRPLELGEQGLIMLRSRYVTAVDSVLIDDFTVETDFYDWYPEGWIQRKYHYWSRGNIAHVTYSHGYDELPADLMLVVLELMNNAIELPSGTATSFKTPGYGITFGELGNSLTEAHKARLSAYKIGWVI